MHVLVEEPQRVAAGGLGVVHGQIGATQQFVDGLALTPKHHNADAGRAVQGLALQLIRLGQAVQYLFTHVQSASVGLLFVAAQALDQHHEFVTAQARQRVSLAHAALQPFRHLNQQLVPLVMALRVVQGLEVVQVQVQQCRIGARTVRRRHGTRQAVVQQTPVGLPGQRVEVGQLLDLCFRLAPFGDVGQAGAQQPALCRWQVHQPDFTYQVAPVKAAHLAHR